jgi:ABC-type nitrate/sulfonate/bicarbonate transport system substrate-binding protein
MKASKWLHAGFGLVMSLSFPRLLLSAENPWTVISYPARPPKLPLWLAHDEKLFEKHGVNVIIQELATSEDLIAAVRDGKGSIYAGTVRHIMSGIGDGADVVFFANTGYSVLKLLARPAITRPEELKGKRVGTGERNSSQDRITRQTLKILGLDPDGDVILVPFGSRSIQRLNALLAGQIDATTSNEDNIHELEKRGDISKVRVLADNESLRLFIGGGVDFAVSRSLLVKDRSKVKAFIEGLSEASALARRDRARSDHIYTRYQNVRDADRLEFMYRTYVLKGIPQKPFPRPEAIVLGLEEFGSKPGLEGKKKEDLIDSSLVDELEKEGWFETLARAAR